MHSTVGLGRIAIWITLWHLLYVNSDAIIYVPSAWIQHFFDWFPDQSAVRGAGDIRILFRESQ